MKKRILLLSLFSLAIAACSKDDDKPVEQPNTGGDSGQTQQPQQPESVSEGGVFKPSVGGPNEPNQVFVDLSAKSETTVKRDSWDFGFYCGDDFRVILNSTVKMAAKQLDTNDITAIQTEDRSVSVGFSTAANLGYVDSPWGELKSAQNTKGRQTAIAEVSATDADNKVYLVNMGFAVGTTTPEKGGTALDGEARGFKKVRITRSGNDYVIHYANLNETTAKSITVKKNPAYNFVFVSLNQEKIVNVQPEKTKWDISFTGLTNYTAMRGGDQITYYFADMVTNNFYSGVKVKKVTVDKAEKLDAEYAAYDKAKASEINFDDPKLNHQLGIGASWRNTVERKLTDTIFYIIKDGSGNLYKLRFLALSKEDGERGYPVFEYALLK